MNNIVVAKEIGGDWSEQMREDNALMAEYDRGLPGFYDARNQLYTLFIDNDPMVIRSFHPMKDAWSYDVYVKINHRKVRFSGEAPNIDNENAEIDADKLVEHFKILLIEYFKIN